MKVIITGGAGFIGSHIQDRLIKLGHEVGIIDNLRSGKKHHLNSKAQFFEVDVCNKLALTNTLQDFKAEAVFHLAAQNEVPYSMTHQYEDEQINIVGMMNLMEGCVASKVKKVVYSNTGGALYGDISIDKLPIKEDQPVLRPTSFYGVSKGAAESYLKLYGNLHHIQWVSLRYPNVYGPRQDGNKEAGIVAIFTTKMLKNHQPVINGDGKHTRDYIFVEDVVDANLKALDFPQSDYFNISTGIQTSNLQVFEAIEEVLQTGMKAAFGPERAGDALYNCLSPEKANAVLGWSVKTNFKQGVKQTIEYYLNQQP